MIFTPVAPGSVCAVSVGSVHSGRVTYMSRGKLMTVALVWSSLMWIRMFTSLRVLPGF